MGKYYPSDKHQSKAFTLLLRDGCIHAKSLQSRPTLCDTMSVPGSSVHVILQAREVKCVVMPSYRGFPRPRDPTYSSWDSNITGVFFTTEPLGNPS